MNDQTPSDEQLVESFVAGDMSAFESIVHRYQNDLYAFLMNFMGNIHDTEDVFQNTCLQIYKSAPNFDTTRRFKPWLFTIAANKARDRLRQKKRKRMAELDAPAPFVSHEEKTFVDLIESSLPDPQEVIRDKDAAEKMRHCVDGLKPAYREVLLLAYYHQFSYQEIATMLHVPVSTIKGRLHMAVKQFATAWKNNQTTLKN